MRRVLGTSLGHFLRYEELESLGVKIGEEGDAPLCNLDRFLSDISGCKDDLWCAYRTPGSLSSRQDAPLWSKPICPEFAPCATPSGIEK